MMRRESAHHADQVIAAARLPLIYNGITTTNEDGACPGVDNHMTLTGCAICL